LTPDIEFRSRNNAPNYY